MVNLVVLIKYCGCLYFNAQIWQNLENIDFWVILDVLHFLTGRVLGKPKKFVILQPIYLESR
jgi:hypothetical protein